MAQQNENAAAWFVDRHVGTERGDKPAFIEAGAEGRSMSYNELGEATARMAGLLARHGLRREDRIALLVLDRIEWPVIFWGALKAGVVPVALNTLLGTDVYDLIFDDCRARALFVSAELLPVVEQLLPGHPWIEKVFVIGGEAGEGRFDFAAELAASAPAETVSVTADECAFWLYSSGSTGRPKGVRHVHSNLRATADTYGAQVLGIRPEDRVLSAAKLFFAYGLGNSMTFPMSVGASAVLWDGRPTPETMFAALESHKPTIFYGVPTLYAAMLAELQKGRARPDAPLRLCVSAGEALPPEIGERWREIWGVDILDGVGSTELLHIFLSNRPGDVAYGTAGRPVPGYEVKLVDEEGKEVAPGEIGEMIVKGESAAEGYWNQRAKSRATFEGHWTRTGDKYVQTEDGRYVVCGRTDDMFKVSGIWVSPFEVEQALIAHPRVLEAAVVPFRDAEGLEKPRAFVVLKEGEGDAALAQELREMVKARIGKWKYPRDIRFVTDLPKTATGKIQRFRLREEG